MLIRRGASLRLGFLAMALLATESCSVLVGPDGVPLSFRVVALLAPDLSVPDPGKAYLAPPVITLVGGTGVVAVSGDFLLPCANYGYRVHTDRARDVVEMWLEVRREARCQNVLIKFQYEAELRELRPGAYTVRVFHELIDSAQGGVGMTKVKEAQVAVS